MIAESCKADQCKNLICRSGRFFLFIADVNENRADDGNMYQVDPEVRRIREIACECLVGLVDDENNTETKECLIDLRVCVGP